jgi:hypothetical protein
VAPPFYSYALNEGELSASHLSNITPREIVPYAKDRTVGCPQRRSERSGVRKNPLTLAGNQNRALKLRARCHTKLSTLQNLYSVEDNAF